MSELITLPYSQKDPTDILATVKTNLTTYTNGQWTDFSDADPGYALVKTFVSLLDMAFYFTDQSVAECFLSTCTQRESAVRIAKMLDYIPTTPEPATVQLQINVNPTFGSQFIIPANSLWSVNNQTFCVLDSITFPALQSSVTVSAIQGVPYSATFVADGSQWFSISIPDNIANVNITDDTDNTWYQVDSWIGITQYYSYKLYEDTNGGQTIKFGANIIAAQPNNGDVITVTGITTNGADGNFENSGYPITPLSTIMDGPSNVTNNFKGVSLTGSVGGLSTESINSIRQNAPAYYSTQGRLVTASDFQAAALNVSGVEGAVVIGGQQINMYGSVVVIVYGDDPYNVSTDLINLVQTTLQKNAVVTITVVVLPPDIVEVTNTVTLGVNQLVLSDLSIARNNAIAAISAMYANNLGIADDFYESEALSNLQVLNGTKYAHICSSLKSFATSTAGLIKIPLVENYLLTNCVLTDLDDNILFSGNGASFVTGSSIQPYFLFTDVGLTDQKCTLTYETTSSDILVTWKQLLSLLSVNITAAFA